MLPSIPSSSITKFFMASPPVGWTKLTTGVDDCALRVTSGTVTGGGSNPFTTAFSSKTASGVRNLTLATDNSVTGATSHIHNTSARSLSGPNSRASGPTYVKPPTLPAPTQTIHTWPGTKGQSATTSVGGGQGHTHALATPAALNSPITGATINFSVNYVDVILGQRN